MKNRGAHCPNLICFKNSLLSQSNSFDFFSKNFFYLILATNFYHCGYLIAHKHGHYFLSSITFVIQWLRFLKMSQECNF